MQLTLLKLLTLLTLCCIYAYIYIYGLMEHFKSKAHNELWERYAEREDGMGGADEINRDSQPLNSHQGSKASAT